MRDTIVDIQRNIRQGQYVNEAAVSQGIVLRILSGLGWPTFDTNIVSPESMLGGTRPDFVLCHPPKKPVVLVEVKRIGLGKDAEHQLFGYAVHHGVPLAVLTTGQEWQFFVPTQPGDYEERRVYMLDLLEREPVECVARLQRYLDYESVCSGRAIEAAQADYRDMTKEREIKKVLPDAWSRLVREEDELLLDLVAEKVESLCGYLPNRDLVASYLTAITKHSLSAAEPKASMLHIRPPVGAQAIPAFVEPQRQSGTREFAFTFQGQSFAAASGRDVLIGVLRRMAELDPAFPERMAARTQTGKKRRRLARSKLDLFPGSPHLADDLSNSRELAPGSGWWVDMNLSLGGIDKMIRTACEVMGLRYGEDVKVRW